MTESTEQETKWIPRRPSHPSNDATTHIHDDPALGTQRSGSQRVQVHSHGRRAPEFSKEYDNPTASADPNDASQLAQNLDEGAIDRFERREIGLDVSNAGLIPTLQLAAPASTPSGRERGLHQQSTGAPSNREVQDDHAQIGGHIAISAMYNTTERAGDQKDTAQSVTISRFATQTYTLSYLVLFSILGTLARLGLQALTTYPGAPVSFGILWANFAGCVTMGFLVEDRKLFRLEWGTPTYDQEILKARQRGTNVENGSGPEHPTIDLAAAKKAHAAVKKTIPLYIGLATGFCGSFTSFSSFIRDAFLALSNDLPSPGLAGTSSRNGGYSFMALIAVILTTVCLSLSALLIGAHLALAIEPLTPSFPYRSTRKYLDPIAAALGWGSWLGAILLCIFPPHDAWRGQVLFSLVFAPLGCLARFFASLYLNGRIASFPLGTFMVNVAGTVILGMCWDLAHVPLGGIVGCQVLQGVEDGFCGCLTTVSTWVAELASLRRRQAYTYGSLSVLVSLVALVAIMGGMRWGHGFEPLLC